MPSVYGKRFPRAARRARKPMQDNWVKVPRGRWLKCIYEKCGYTWQYFGGHSWAECPACRTTMKVSLASKNYHS
ncbi:MAG: hypothetical protein DA330_10180 [Nitrososphaera sp.]|jgi:hypothetical protein|nr:hypothetical protein [Nitrososphaera sp.]